MLFMLVERFKGRDPVPIYQRVREHGRALPDGLRYLDSWVEVNFDRCFQLMECNDAGLLMRWILQWRDLAEFEVVPVSPSREVRALFEGGGAEPAAAPDPAT
ncbi:MAG: DUF3303 family protein [Planctomycetes bacterium]|nr:DUF3303 family protein [Planctomycetota bacterium]